MNRTTVWFQTLMMLFSLLLPATSAPAQPEPGQSEPAEHDMQILKPNNDASLGVLPDSWNEFSDDLSNITIQTDRSTTGHAAAEPRTFLKQEQDAPATNSGLGEEPHAAAAAHGGGHGGRHAELQVPSLLLIAPFVILLLCIALLPLIHRTEHWWHQNRNKLIVALSLGLLTTSYYLLRDFGFPHKEGAEWHVTATGLPAVLAMLEHAIIVDYIPFIVLLFSLYVCSGGINLRGDIQATPTNNTLLIAIGTVLANFIGTTGAAMLLIRPLLQINRERKYVVHTVICFIFLCCNIGGCLLPIGDPPLFLGYLRGVPFTWTLGLFPEWLITALIVLLIYFSWDNWRYQHETPADRYLDQVHIEPLKVSGAHNFLFLIGIVLCVALLVPGQQFAGLQIPLYFREALMLLLVAAAWFTTRPEIRAANKFDFVAIGEVACLFIGIFITMQVPLEILNLTGGTLPLNSPMHFFWTTGALSSFLDNAPTYVVFMQAAAAKTEALIAGGAHPATLDTLLGRVELEFLVAISLGAVFMGAMTYIGNGPNFMVKSIAESSGVKMPSFFGYMLYSCAILIPVFLLITLVFLYPA